MPAPLRHHRGGGQPTRPRRPPPPRQTDALDAAAAAHAAHAAHAVLSGRANATAKTGDGPVEMLRLFKLARTSAVKARTQAINQLKAVIVGADPALRETMTGLAPTALIRHCANLPEAAPTDAATAACYTLRRLAARIQALTAEERYLRQQIATVLKPTPRICYSAMGSDPTAPPRCSSPPETTPTALLR